MTFLIAMTETASEKPLWISHRGYNATATENTLEAFKAAVDIGFTACETDLRITNDDHIVLIHDPTLIRLANDSRQVRELSRIQLEKLGFTGGGKPLFFDQLVKDFAGLNWVFDIKPENGGKTIRAMVDWCRSHSAENWLTGHGKFLAWRKSHEILLNRLLPGIECYAREMECWRADLAVLMGLPSLGGIEPNRTYAIPPRLAGVRLFRKSAVECFHRRQASTVAFLPDTEQDARAAMEAGFDEILTNGRIIDTDVLEKDA
jgi:glycerophosphoryl diester phosphodiesterase